CSSDPHALALDQVNELLQRHFVVAHDQHLGAQLAQVLHDVVGKAVVVIQHQDFHSRPSSTSSAARSRARALCSVSCHSSSGTESATTPAAACTYSVPSLITPVRMAMAMSMWPAKLK